MPSTTTPELYWLTLTAVMTALLWLPYILNQIVRMGLMPALTNSNPAATERSDWARRATAAHNNAVENLVVFTALALAVHLTGTGNETTGTACMIYFIVRAAHYIVYVLGVPVLRTLLFAAGVGCQLTLAGAVLGSV
ncbi:MAG: MAPEG family protein [Gammaproteobacteria bacterium]|nr:MAPEG family protein [Gammaproteobacteria bacterium]